jgi:hypothetical protein
MQSYANKDNVENKKYDDNKSKTSAGSQTDKKSATQDLDQDNFCYRGNETCTQANEGQQIVGKDNDAVGFNDQSDNLALFSSSAGTGTTTPPTPKTCLECFAPILLSSSVGELGDFLREIGVTSLIPANICNLDTFSEAELTNLLDDIGVLQSDIDALIQCLRDAGVTITA